MTTVFAQALNKVEAFITKAEGIAEEDLQYLAKAAEGFFTTIEPTLLSALLKAAQAVAVDLLTDPQNAVTNILNELEADGQALWTTLKPEAQTAAINAVAGVVALNRVNSSATQAGVTAPAPAP